MHDSMTTFVILDFENFKNRIKIFKYDGVSQYALEHTSIAASVYTLAGSKDGQFLAYVSTPGLQIFDGIDEGNMNSIQN